MLGQQGTYSLEDILTETQVHHILKQNFNLNGSWQVEQCDLRPATRGLAGFLGTHLRVTLYIKTEEGLKTAEWFIKCVPLENEPKAKLIDECNYFRREALMFELLKELRGDDGVNPWCTKAFLFNEKIIVMPDLTATGYSVRPQMEVFDLQHTLLVTESIARFHAAFVNYQMRKRNENNTFNFLQQYENLLSEPIFRDSPWMRVAAKLIADFVKSFSKKYRNKFRSLKMTILKLFLTACDNFKVHEDTLNVIIHRDLWVNNIMFKVRDAQPTNALLIDFQCIRFCPPAFDLMIMLYLTTSRSFREQREQDIQRHYFATFTDSLESSTKTYLKGLKYGFEEFCSWCDRARCLGAVVALGIFPYVLMDPERAQRVFDDPGSFERVNNEDRSEPVLAFARTSSRYRTRILDVCEEFIERYVDNSCECSAGTC